MHCPFCQNLDTKVINSRVSDDGHSVKRRRECPICQKRFTTSESALLLVRKSSGAVEPFSRSKVIAGVRKACQGRPIADEDLRNIGRVVEEELLSRGQAQIPSEEIGKAILEPLSKLDVVAYLRFASVYQHFENLDDFQEAINNLK